MDINLAEQLYQEVMKEAADHPETVRLTHEKLCVMCVRTRCRNMKLARSLSVDHKIMTELLKQPLPTTVTSSQTNGNSSQEDDTTVPLNEEQFWVGKNTVKKWRAFAREALDQKCKEETVRYLGKLPYYFVACKIEKAEKMAVDFTKAKIF